MTETIRLRLDVSYDGADFSGWAAQPGRRTVAGVLTEALHRILGASGTEWPLGLTVAGRTDAGVHATGQVCHIDLPAERYAELSGSLPRRLSALMPPDARVRSVTPVPDTFDARFSATFRRYEYRVCDDGWGPEPLRRYDTLGWLRPLDEDRLNAAASGLLGEHDFAAFCKRKEHATTIRAINRLDWRREPDRTLVATVQADAFCQAMVRSLVGAMLAVGEGRREPEWPAKLLTLRERSSEVAVAPAHGLTLVAVGYPDAAEYAARADATRRRRD
ncbi:tRNA pseudouridine(38-40) synthase TruA [Actinoplanes teichomyceticus]|uniref:tRNA pseudouridine synthase A n=1 Tax=Actinoplanes teichomyceticus TaxID=1867 RepID=A0A561VQI0_ACTTI|nr:tRNA pseudouridine(38-40) synthase TruA [Actinoplanes teichomyceticus]TWG13876.1 tRNA pseudouridine38-40 synthase [Actinoplanes teichomyceticus]GIF12300.1 tRNA pseudouridine synthase A [Actinoplanes teichomyceticus]